MARITLGQLQRERTATAVPFARAGDLLPPPPPPGSTANTVGVVVALGVLALSIVGLRGAHREADRWGGPGGRG